MYTYLCSSCKHLCILQHSVYIKSDMRTYLVHCQMPELAPNAARPSIQGLHGLLRAPASSSDGHQEASVRLLSGFHCTWASLVPAFSYSFNLQRTWILKKETLIGARKCLQQRGPHASPSTCPRLSLLLIRL